MTENELLSRAGISDTLIRYCHAQDQNCWALYDAVFDADARVEHSGPVPRIISAAQHRKELLEFSGSRVSGQHLIGNTVFTIDGETARTVSEVMHVTLQETSIPHRLVRIRGNALYVDDLVRRPDRWRIRYRIIACKNLERDEVDYDPALLEHIRETSAADWFNRHVGP